MTPSSTTHVNSNAAKATHHLESLDALRGIAIALVIAAHVSNDVLSGDLPSKALHFAGTGVQLFYVLSALTLMMSMNRRERQERYPHLYYTLRRFFRIAPSFYFTLLVYWLLRNTSWTPATRPFVHTGLTIAFLNGWRPDTINDPVTGQWSIAVEVMFYLLLPFLVLQITTFRRSVVAWYLSLLLYIASHKLGMGIASLEGFDASSQVAKDFCFFYLFNQLPVFLSGVSLYFILRENRSLTRALAVFAPGALLICLTRYIDSGSSIVPIYGIVFMPCVSILMAKPVSAFVNRLTVLLGSVSFSAYLWHPIVLNALLQVFPWFRKHPGLPAFCLLYVLCCGVGIPLFYLLWRLIEMPMQKIGRKIIRTIEGAAQPIEATTV